MGCRLPAAVRAQGGDVNFGKNYTLLLQALVSGGVGPIDTANVYCPSYQQNLYLPTMRR
jgi:hypothetical protein